MNLSLSLIINPLIAMAVLASTAVTDAAYVFFNAAVTARGAFAPRTGARSGTCCRRSP